MGKGRLGLGVPVAARLLHSFGTVRALRRCDQVVIGRDGCDSVEEHLLVFLYFLFALGAPN